MKAVFALDPFKESELRGNAAEWRAFAVALSTHDATIPCGPVLDPAPYTGYVRTIRVIRSSSEKVSFIVTSDASMIIQGDPELLKKLSGSAMNLATDFPNGSHTHIEYQGDGHFIAKDCFSVVLFLDVT